MSESKNTMVNRYRRAGNLARIAMGKRKVRGDKPVENATEDPLAWWALTEAIVAQHNPTTGKVEWK